MHVRKGDTVVVIAGKEKGKRGRVLRILSAKGRVLVERINMIKRHMKPNQQTRQGGILEKESPIHISNLMLICSKCTDPTRVGYKTLDDDRKVRYCKKCQEVLE